MSETTPQQIAERTLSAVEEALRHPGEAEKALDGLLAQINAQNGLSATARREAANALEGQRRSIRETRLAEIGAELKSALRRAGLALEYRVLKRRQRKSAKPAGPQPAEQASAPAGSEPSNELGGRETRHGAQWGRDAS